MAQSGPLSRFVETALAQGRSRSEIRNALVDAGWSEQEAEDALAAFADMPFTPPVPRPRPVVSARDFFIYALIAVSLAIVAYNLVDLLQSLINQAFEAEIDVESRGDWSRISQNRSLAAIIVFAPIYVLLSRGEARRRATDPARDRSAIRSWTIAGIQLCAVLTLLGSLSWAVFVLLQDGLDVPRLLNVAVSAVVAGGVWWIYRTLPDRLS